MNHLNHPHFTLNNLLLLCVLFFFVLIVIFIVFGAFWLYCEFEMKISQFANRIHNIAHILTELPNSFQRKCISNDRPRLGCSMSKYHNTYIFWYLVSIEHIGFVLAHALLATGAIDIADPCHSKQQTQFAKQ